MKRYIKINGNESCKLINWRSINLINVDCEVVEPFGKIVKIKIYQNDLKDPLIGFTSFDDYEELIHWISRSYVQSQYTIWTLDALDIQIKGNAVWREIEQEEQKEEVKA